MLKRLLILSVLSFFICACSDGGTASSSFDSGGDVTPPEPMTPVDYNKLSFVTEGSLSYRTIRWEDRDPN